MNSNKRWTNEEKCKNCRNLHHGSIIKLDDRGACAFCGRQVWTNEEAIYAKTNEGDTYMTTPANEWREEFERFMKTHSTFQGGLSSNIIPDLKDFIQNLLDQHTAHLVEKILKLAPGIENTQTGEVTYDFGVMEYMARIKAIDIVKDNNK
jgi:hypothetical protein